MIISHLGRKELTRVDLPFVALICGGLEIPLLLLQSPGIPDLGLLLVPVDVPELCEEEQGDVRYDYPDQGSVSSVIVRFVI